MALLLMPRRLLDQPSTVRRMLLETNLGDLFNRRFSIERTFYRRHRMAGALVLAGAFAILVLLWTLPGYPIFWKWFTGIVGHAGARIAVVGVATAALGLAIVGACLLVRPSVLKGFEAAANRWIEPLPPANPHMALSRLIIRAPRVTGLLLLAASLPCWRLL